MQTHFINHLFTGQTIQVLFWTLVHSLWQGILFAFFTAVVLITTKKSASALRYKLLSSVFILFVSTSACTFCYEVISILHHNPALYSPVIAFPGATVAAGNHAAGIIERLISFLQPYQNLIVLIWFAVITIKCLGLAKGLHNVYILKHRRVFDAGEYWNHRLQALAENSGIKKQVRLLKSTLAKVPLVIGYFKPVILFPAAALTALPPLEIEAVLLHELAHIRRDDYLINIFQRITEIIFFFNPAVLWISSLIKEERENCCDDIAVRQTKNKKQFIHALVSFQECSTSGYAASFSGRKNLLLNRVKRIITNNNKTLSTMEKTFLSAGILVTAFMAFAFSQARQSPFKNNAALQATQIARTGIKKDTVPQTADSVSANGSKYTFGSTINGKKYRLVEVNGKPTALYVDNVKIPADKISGYNDIINQLQENLEMAKQNQHNAIKAQSEALQAQITLMQANKLAVAAQVQKNIKENMDVQAKELQQEMAAVNMENNADKQQGRVEALKADAALLQQKALAMSDTKGEISKMQLEVLEAAKAQTQNDLITQLQATKLAALANDSDIIHAQAGELEAIVKEQALMREQHEKQSKIIKEKTDKIINEELKIQIEELKQQNEELKQQLRQIPDSIHITPALPRGA